MGGTPHAIYLHPLQRAFSSAFASTLETTRNSGPFQYYVPFTSDTNKSIDPFAVQGCNATQQLVLWPETPRSLSSAFASLAGEHTS